MSVHADPFDRHVFNKQSFWTMFLDHHGAWRPDNVGMLSGNAGSTFVITRRPLRVVQTRVQARFIGRVGGLMVVVDQVLVVLDVVPIPDFLHIFLAVGHQVQPEVSGRTLGVVQVSVVALVLQFRLDRVQTRRNIGFVEAAGERTQIEGSVLGLLLQKLLALRLKEFSHLAENAFIYT